MPARAPNFPLHAPMLVMRLSILVEQGRIPRSDQAHARGLLELLEQPFNGSARIAVFISMSGGRRRTPEGAQSDAPITVRAKRQTLNCVCCLVGSSSSSPSAVSILAV